MPRSYSCEAPFHTDAVARADRLFIKANCGVRPRGGSPALAKYPETAPLLTVNGVGTLTAVTFVLTLGDKSRFRHSRDVGCYLGLRPKRHQSGSRDPELGITKRGNRYMRCILVQCAQHILRSISADSALKRWGLKLAGRNGRNAKKRALIAVARKLAVLLHRLWVSQENFDPFYGCRKTAA
jgi:transposase